MAVRIWQTIKVCYCEHAGAEVGLEAEVVYPSDILPDQPPQVLAHRCSHGFDCMCGDHISCVWSGSNPLYDPFQFAAPSPRSEKG